MSALWRHSIVCLDQTNILVISWDLGSFYLSHYLSAKNSCHVKLLTACSHQDGYGTWTLKQPMVMDAGLFRITIALQGYIPFLLCPPFWTFWEEMEPACRSEDSLQLIATRSWCWGRVQSNFSACHPHLSSRNGEKNFMSCGIVWLYFKRGG